MNLVNDNNSNILNKVPGLSRSGDSIPLLWSCHDHSSLCNCSSISSNISSQLHNLLPKLMFKPVSPVRDPFPDQSLQRSNVDNLGLGSLSKHPEHCQFCHDGFARASGSAQQNVSVRMIKGMEELGLNWIKVAELVQQLKLCLIEGSHGQRLEIQKIRMWRMSLRKGQMFK